MTIAELIERLTEYQDMFGDDVEVRLMTQEQWPFENRIFGICSSDELDTDDEEHEPAKKEWETDSPEDVVYIVEGGQIGYGTKNAWEACR